MNECFGAESVRSPDHQGPDGPLGLPRTQQSRCHILDHRHRELAGLHLGRVVHEPMQVVGDLLLPDRFGDARFRSGRPLPPSHEPEHHRARENQARGIDHVLVGILGRGAVRRLEHSLLIANVGARRHSQPADLGGTGIRDVVAVQVRRRKHVVLGRRSSTCWNIESAIRSFTRILPSERRLRAHSRSRTGRRTLLAPARSPSRGKPFGELLDVALMHESHALAAVLDRIFNRPPHEPLRPGNTHRLDADT